MRRKGASVYFIELLTQGELHGMKYESSFFGCRPVVLNPNVSAGPRYLLGKCSSRLGSEVGDIMEGCPMRTKGSMTPRGLFSVMCGTPLSLVTEVQAIAISLLPSLVRKDVTVIYRRRATF